MTLHFDYRDLFRCVRMGWSGKKIWVGLVGLLIAWLGYSGLLVVAHLRDGMSLGALWHEYGLFVGARLGAFDLLGTILHGIGMVWVVAVVLISMCMMCKITFQQLRGDDFYDTSDAWKFIKQHWTAVILGPLGVLALFVFLAIGGILIGLVARWIPVAGELFFALGFIPIFFLALLGVFTAIVFLVALSLSPAIVGTVGEDALEVVIQSFSIFWSQPWRLLLYAAWMKISSGFGFLILSALSLAALWSITWACGLFMETKLANLFEIATGYLPFVPRRWDMVLANLPDPSAISFGERWGGRILGVMLIGISGMVLSYGLAVQASGWTLIYVILRRFKDGENLLEWEMDDWGQVDTFDETVAVDNDGDIESDQEVEPITEEQDDTTDSEKT